MTHRLTWWQNWTTWLGLRKAAEPVVVPRQEEIAPQRLRKILVVVGRIPGSRTSEQLLVDRMSPDCWLFITRGDVGEGEILEIQVLVPGFGPITLQGTIAWLRPTSRGCLEGELMVHSQPHQREILADYLARDARGER